MAIERVSDQQSLMFVNLSHDSQNRYERIVSTIVRIRQRWLHWHRNYRQIRATISRQLSSLVHAVFTLRDQVVVGQARERNR